MKTLSASIVLALLVLMITFTIIGNNLIPYLQANESVKSKMSVMESRRQDLYLEILRKRGQLIEGPGGGSSLVSLAQLPLRMPRTLKIKNFTDWLDREKVWANV